MADRAPSFGGRLLAPGLLAREVAHRASNDLQMIVGLLFIESRRAAGDEVRGTLEIMAERVAIIGRARSSTLRGRQQTLADALRQVCDALRPAATAQGVMLALDTGDCPPLSLEQVTTLALPVNELATNALKHAYPDGTGGTIAIRAERSPLHGLVVTVEDDGQPFAGHEARVGSGNGLGIVRALLHALDALLIAPEAGSKRYEIRAARP